MKNASAPRTDNLEQVILNGTYFTINGRYFIPIGAHWIPAQSALQWPYLWNESEIEADFKTMRDLGFNTMRFDLFWAWFEPRPGDYNPEAFHQFDFLIVLAHRYRIHLHPVLFVGGEVGDAFWDVPWRQGRHPHADAEMLRLQTDHAAEFAKRYRDETAILAWDLADEPPFWIVSGQTTDAMAINWTRLIAGAMRRYDPTHALCVGTNVEDLDRGPFRPDIISEEVDFFSVHPYSIYMLDRFPDPMLSERGSYCGAFQVALSAGAGKPVMVHEFGASSAQYSPAKIADYDRITMYSSLAAGANGFLAWCFTDASPETFNRVPYLRAPHETQFGLTTWDRLERPRGLELRDFAGLLAKLELNGIEPSPADAALLVPWEWSKQRGDYSRLGLSGPEIIPYTSVQDHLDMREDNVWLTGSWLSAFILARRAGISVNMTREYDEWRNKPLVLLPSPLTSTERDVVHVHSSFWKKAAEYVKNGGILYASLCADAAVPEMEKLFGAASSDHVPVKEAAITIVREFGGLTPGVSFHYQLDSRNPRHWPVTLDVCGGTIIAEDQDGRPALIAHELDQGKTLLSAYPLEAYLATTPSAFESGEKTHQLYRALCRRAGYTPRFAADSPSVEAGALNGNGRGYAVFANHCGLKLTVTVESREPLSSVKLVTKTGHQPLTLHGRSWRMEMPGYGGAVVEWTAQ